MKILHLLYDHRENPWVGGGGAVRAWELNRRLVARGHAVTNVSGKYPGAADHAGEDGIAYRHVGSALSYAASTFSYILGARKFVKAHAEEFDVVVEDFATWNPLFITGLTTRPTVLHVNHREGTGVLRRMGPLGLPFYLAEPRYPQHFRHVTALSEETRRKIGRPDALVLPAGIGSEFIARQRETKTDRSHGLILFVGRLEIGNKGLDTLIGAMRFIAEQPAGLGASLRLVLAGRGRDEARLRTMADGLPVEFAGFVTEEEKERLLNEAAIFVLPSRFEGWGIVVLEAAACGAPVVVSSIPELGYAVADKYGAAFRTGDPADLARVLLALSADPARRAAMSEAGRTAVERYTWERITDTYEQYLQSVTALTARA